MREQPALVVLDIRMEQPDAGLRVLHELRENPETAGLPVLICTADTRFAREHGAWLRAHGYGLVAKPFDVEALLARVGAMVVGPREAGDAGTGEA